MNKGTLKNDTLVLVCSLYWPVRHQVLNILYALYAYSFFLKRKIAFHWPEELYCISLVTNRWHIFVSMQSSSYSVQLSCVQLFATPWITACQACPSPTPGVYPNSCPLSRWYHPTISSSVITTLHNDQGINPRERQSNCKYLCMQQRSTSIYKTDTNRHKRRNWQ